MKRHAPAMQDFSQVIVDGTSDILFQWRRLLRSLRGDDPLSVPEKDSLQATLHTLLQQLAVSFGRGAFDVDQAAVASARYGELREEKEARASDVMRELRLLKQCAIEHVAAKHPSIDPATLLQLVSRSDLLFDEATSCAVERFVESLFQDEPSEDPAFHQLEGQFHLHRELDLELERSHRHQRSFAVVIVSIHTGLPRGLSGPYQADQVLLDLMRLIRGKLRASDRIFRYDNNDFVILCPETSLQNVTTLHGRLCLDIETYKRQNALALDVTIGVATYPEDAKDSLSLIQVALADQSFRLDSVPC